MFVSCLLLDVFLLVKCRANVGKSSSGVARIKTATAKRARDSPKSLASDLKPSGARLFQDVAHWVAIASYTHSCEKTFVAKSAYHFQHLREQFAALSCIYAKDNREIHEFRLDFGRLKSDGVVAFNYLCDMLASSVHETAVLDLLRGKLSESPRLHFFCLNREAEECMMGNGLPRSLELPPRIEAIHVFPRVSMALFAVVEHEIEAAIQIEVFKDYFAFIAVCR